MKQCLSQAGRKSIGTNSCEELKNSIYEACRPWLETEGDLDDFIFYQSESPVSER